MMYIYATKTIEVDRVIDGFANAKKRRLLLLLSRPVGMKLKFDRNIITIIKLLVFKELPPFESSGYVPDHKEGSGIQVEKRAELTFNLNLLMF